MTALLAIIAQPRLVVAYSVITRAVYGLSRCVVAVALTEALMKSVLSSCL